MTVAQRAVLGELLMLAAGFRQVIEDGRTVDLRDVIEALLRRCRKILRDGVVYPATEEDVRELRGLLE